MKIYRFFYANSTSFIGSRLFFTKKREEHSKSPNSEDFTQIRRLPKVKIKKCWLFPLLHRFYFTCFDIIHITGNFF
jgi:hypothetical protein